MNCHASSHDDGLAFASPVMAARDGFRSCRGLNRAGLLSLYSLHSALQRAQA